MSRATRACRPHSSTAVGNDVPDRSGAREAGPVARALQAAVLVSLGLVAAGAVRAAEPVSAGQAALQELRTFATTGRVLHVGAHPDDENTQLIAYLSRGRGFDTAYLSITRGDGGQNLLGPQFDEKLGVARTQELLAARRVDGGRQFFTRAIDFGFSKNPAETLSIWNHQAVLSDVVRVIRTFRPDVIVTRFPIPPGSGGHGHHTASAMLAVEAFKLAGDPTAFPEQLQEGLKPWQPKRVLWNAWFFGRSNPLEDKPKFQEDIAGKDPVTGESFASIATRSRRMHKTQALGSVPQRDISLENFVLLAGEPARSDLVDGVDTTWARLPGGAEIGRRAQDAIAHFDVEHPGASVPALLAIRQQLATLADGVIVDDKRRELDDVLRRCLGLQVTTVASRPDVVPGEQVRVHAAVRAAADAPIRWISVAGGGADVAVNAEVAAKQPLTRDFTFSVASSMPLTTPYWLREKPSVGMYTVTNPRLIGRPENPPALPVRYTFEVGGQTLQVDDELRGPDGHNRGGLDDHKVVVIPPVSLTFGSGVEVLRPGATRHVAVTVRAARPNARGTVRLAASPGWACSAGQAFQLAQAGDETTLDFDLTAPSAPDGGTVRAEARVGGIECATTANRIEYSHIPTQLLQPPAEIKVVSVDVATRGHTVGYIPGAGDDIPAALAQLGYEVKTLPEGGLNAAALHGLDAVVIGVRAFNTRADLKSALPALFEFVHDGGTVVAQYNRPGSQNVAELAPYPLRISDRRVTNENAPVTFVAPQHPALNTPNKITAADFEGWVQERGIYFPTEWDSHFVPLLSMSDPGEAPLQGALLVAPYGKGYYVYTGLVFFRELPSGVPGAYRLFANLVSLGK